MAKKYYDEKITLDTDWGGDESTGNLPVSGKRVQEVIKEGINSKVGYVGRVGKTGKYVMTINKNIFDAYEASITEENPNGDESLIIASFLAPVEYSSSIEVITPTNGYGAVLEGETGNVLKFKPVTKNSKGELIEESYTYTVTFRNGATTQTYNGRINANSYVEINIDKFLLKGVNTITITSTGLDTNVSGFKNIEYKVLEISLVDSFEINNVYDLSENNQELYVNYKAKSNGPTRIKWFIDNELVYETIDSNMNTENGVFKTTLEKGRYTQGVHSLRFYMVCEDTSSNDIFTTKIYHRDFFVYTGAKVFPMIGMSFDMPFDEAIITNKKNPNIFNAVQYENIDVKFSVYNKGVNTSNINIDVLKPGEVEYTNVSILETKNDEIYNYNLNLEEKGLFTLKLSVEDVEYIVGPFNVEENKIKLEFHKENLFLHLDANGKSNSSPDKDIWNYNGYETTFNNFSWNNNEGWKDGKLHISNGASIDINCTPLGDSKLLDAGATFEFEFNTLNVYDDNAIVCDIRSNDGKGIVITATEARFIIQKGSSGPESDIAVSTKFKSGENNRISFVITSRGNSSDDTKRDRFIKIYVNGVICGVVEYKGSTYFNNNTSLHFEGTEGSEIEISSLAFYSKALTNNQILDNYIFCRRDINEKMSLYNRNKIYDELNLLDINAVKEQLPVMIFKQRYKNDSNETEGKIEDLETEYIDKKKTVYFDIEYENVQNPTLNFKVTRAKVTPQGTSSMKYPKKNFRFYTAKEDDTVLYDYMGNVVSNRKYSFKNGAAPVKCWCLKADFAESSGVHNTGTARLWNNVLKEAGLYTKAQLKAKETKKDDGSLLYKYDVRTTIDGFPIALFYQEIGQTPKFIGKYNFNNDKSTEDVFGFTGGEKIEGQEYKYFYIGKTKPQINDDEKATLVERYDKISEPDSDSPLFCSDVDGNYYMLRGKKMFDNPRMECWEMLDSGSLIALFKTTDGFAIEDDEKEKVGRYYETEKDGKVEKVFEEAFESRFPDCGDYYHTYNLRILCDWLTSCRCLKIDAEGKSVPMTNEELYDISGETGLTIQSLTLDKRAKCFYQWDNNAGKYVKLESKPNGSDNTNTVDVTEVPTIKNENPKILYVALTYEKQITLSNTAENRLEKFRVEKYDHFDLDKMAAYYIYLMRFGGVDQTVKNAMLTTEGSDDNENPLLPSKWYFINYDNDTILGLKNNGHLVFDPYITRETKEEGGAFAYAGRESTMWNNFEFDSEFMALVSTVDSKLQSGNGLSYANAIDMYNNKQSGQWCERIYNMDAEYKYINTYVSPTQSETSSEQELDYLFDVQGPRSAHRKWWLSKRFNIFDSKFVSGNFLKNAILLKVNDLQGDRNVVLTSGEDIFYAIGGNNGVYYTTSSSIRPGDECTLPIAHGTQIGTPISIYGAPNIEVLNLRNISDSLAELHMGSANVAELGSKLKALYIGDKNNPVINVSNDWTTDGFGSLEKCEEIDMTGMNRQTSIENLTKLKNLRKLYVSGTMMESIKFINGGVLDEIEMPVSLKTLNFKDLPHLSFNNIKFFNITRNNDGVVIKSHIDGYCELQSVSIDNCINMMSDYQWILNWLNHDYAKNNKDSINLYLNGIDWEFDNNFVVNNLEIFKDYNCVIKGQIRFNKDLGLNEVKTLIDIFGEDCFNKNSELRVIANTNVFIIGNEEIIEGDNTQQYRFIKINTEEDAEFTVSIMDNNGSIPNEEYFINVKENNENLNTLFLTINYTPKQSENVKTKTLTISIKNRTYPTTIQLSGSTLIEHITENGNYYEYQVLTFATDDSGNMIPVNGIMDYEWSLEGDAATNTLHDGRPYLVIDENATEGNICRLKLNAHYDGNAVLSVEVKRRYDGQTLFYKENCFINIVISDPSTLFSANKNPQMFEIFKNLDPEKYHTKFTTTDAQSMEPSTLTNNNGSIFTANSAITEFNDFVYFTKIKTISDNMFKECKNLESIGLPSTISSIGNNAFSKCENLITVNNKGSVDTVGNNAFEDCFNLSEINFGGVLEKIGENCFKNCKQLASFSIPSDLTTISYTVDSNPFQGCENISFTGSNNKFKSINGACYEVVDKGYNLIHMGKDTLISQIPTDIAITALSYSMEYRKENEIEIPENIVLNSKGIFYRSSGSTITLKRTVGNDCKELFTETSYNKYNLASNETQIPSYCFRDVKTMSTYEVPENITKIGKEAFYGCSQLKRISFPSTLTEIHENACWLTNLKVLDFYGETPPKINNDMFFACSPDVMLVKPECYEAYKNGLFDLYRPFVSVNDLYDKTYVRIISGGTIINNAENITVDGLSSTGVVNDYLEFEKPVNDYIKDREKIGLSSNGTYDYEGRIIIRLNGEKIGYLKGQYTTIYLGNNSGLFNGEGYNFRYGVYNSGITEEMDETGWYYDERFEGIRNKDMINVNEGITSFVIKNITNLDTLPVVFGMYTHAGSNKNYCFINSDNDNAGYTFTNNGFNIKQDINVDSNKNINIKYQKIANTVILGINGVVINEVGNCRYDESPLYETTNIETKEIKVILNSETNIPENVYITITDNKTHTFCKNYSGNTTIFNIVPGYEYIVKVDGFISSEGKVYLANEVELNDYEEITINFQPSVSGVEMIY